jgi:hypothetical protein
VDSVGIRFNTGIGRFSDTARSRRIAELRGSAVDRGLGNRRIRPPVKEAPKRRYLIHSSARDCADLAGR